MAKAATRRSEKANNVAEQIMIILIVVIIKGD